MIAKIPSIGATDEDQQLHCNQACNAPCTHFTWMKTRGLAFCYLLSGCKTQGYGDDCITLGTCKSGPADCAPLSPNTNCTAPKLLPENTVQWQCVDPLTHKCIDVTKLAKNLPARTTCIQRCSTWKTNLNNSAYLESTCRDDGTWTPTRPHNGDPGLAVQSGPYPLPDYIFLAGGTLKSLSCSCSPVNVVWPPLSPTGAAYDPNDETGAHFICDTPVNFTRGDAILGDNTCRLFCDDFLTANVRCVAGMWSGKLEKGIYCYRNPAGGGGTFSEWTTWTLCTSSFKQTRTRKCVKGICKGLTTDIKQCETFMTITVKDTKTQTSLSGATVTVRNERGTVVSVTTDNKGMGDFIITGQGQKNITVEITGFITVRKIIDVTCLPEKCGLHYVIPLAQKGRNCDEVHSSGFVKPKNCTSLVFKTGLNMEKCRAKCDLNPVCKLWTYYIRIGKTPGCLNFGGTGCHNVIFNNITYGERTRFSGLSACST